MRSCHRTPWFFVGLVSVAISLAFLSRAHAEEPPAQEDPRTVHMAHYAGLYQWEREFARPRSAQLWSQITARSRASLRTDRARVEFILALRPALHELRTLTLERKEAVVSGFCLDKDAAESSVLELMNEFGNTAIRMADKAEILDYARLEGALWGRDRRLFRTMVTGGFFEEAEKFEGMRMRATQLVDAMYQLLLLTNGEESACAGLYASPEWFDRSSWYLYEPSLGWPLVP